MRVFTLDRETFVPAGPADVFRFFASAKNLETLTPPWLHFELLNPEVEIRAGARIDYRLQIHGFPVAWQSEITAWDPPLRFVDEQTRGPYRLWIHEHRFQPTREGTVVGDHVRYAVPGGAIVRRLFVARDLDKIFDFRAARILEIFG
jgi:ligand-binding SRPBCC domain-containing protein